MEVFIEGQTSRLRDGEVLTLNEYRVTIVRAYKDGIPGTYEIAAISRNGNGLHEAVVRAAGRLELTLTAW